VTDFIAQLDTTQFRNPNGEWSIVAILLAGFLGSISALIWIYRSLDQGRLDEINDLKAKVKELEQRNHECYEDRLKIHADLTALRREVELLKVAR
jgi:hypothetical protein